MDTNDNNQTINTPQEQAAENPCPQEPVAANPCPEGQAAANPCPPEPAGRTCPQNAGGPAPAPGAEKAGPGSGDPGDRPTAEELERKSVWSLVFRLRVYTKKYWKRYLISFIAIIAGSLIGLLPSILTGRIVDEALMGKDLGLVVRLAALSLLTVVVARLVDAVTSFLNSWTTQKVLVDVKNDMYSHLQNLGPKFYHSEQQGDIFTRMNSDVMGVSRVLSLVSKQLMSNLSTVVTTVVALFGMNWKLALVGVIIIPFMLLPAQKAGTSKRKLLMEHQQKSDALNQVIHNTLNPKGNVLAKLFNREEVELEIFKDLNEAEAELFLMETKTTLIYNSMNSIITKLGPLLVYIVGCYIMIKNPEEGITVGKITAMVTMLNRLYMPISSILNVGVDLNRSEALLSRVFDYLDRVIDIKNPKKPQKPDTTNATVRFDHVDFGYRPDHQIVYDVNIEAKPGEVIAVVGPSRSGKSTLAHLLIRLYDVWKGSVSIAGTDVRDFDIKYLRDRVGLVTQQLFILSGSVRYNLQFAKQDATQEEIERVCQASGFIKTVERLPRGYETVVGKNGASLTQEEQQKLAIARVLMKNPDILVLDEATSELDAMSESSVHDELIRYMAGKPVILLAQRIATAMKADRIYVMKRGRVVDSGTHEELMERCEDYKALYEAQFHVPTQNQNGEAPVQNPAADTPVQNPTVG